MPMPMAKAAGMKLRLMFLRVRCKLLQVSRSRELNYRSQNKKDKLRLIIYIRRNSDTRNVQQADQLRLNWRLYSQRFQAPRLRATAELGTTYDSAFGNNASPHIFDASNQRTTSFHLDHHSNIDAEPCHLRS
jgi:hypothetical protein